MAWTDERIDQLKTMWEKGMTASQIAEILGGVSRNAVIGKAHRLALEARPSPVKANDSEAKATASAAPEPAPVTSTPPLPKPAPRTFADVPRAPPPPPSPFPPAIPSGPTGAQLRSIGPGGFLRQGRVIRHRQRHLRHLAASSPHGPAPKSRARPACSISATEFANGPSATPESLISTSVATR